MDDDVLKGLWPIELCEAEGKSDIRFAYRGKTVSKPFVAEMARSRKSRCRKCRNHIDMNEFRIGAIRWLPTIGMTVLFFHVACFKRPFNLASIEGDVQVLDSLTDEAFDQLQSILQEVPSKRRKKKVKEAPNSPFKRIFHVLLGDRLIRLWIWLI